MKKIKFLFALCVALSFASCSNDAPEQPLNIDLDFVNDLSRDGSVSTYELKDFKFLEKGKTASNTDWQEKDITNELGFGCTLESCLCFQDGRLWSPAELSSLSTGIYPIGKVWNAYKTVCKLNTELYVSPKFIYDADKGTMKIGKYDYKVIEFTDKTLKLSFESTAWNAEKEQWETMELYDFAITTPRRFDGKDIMAFDSDIECYRYILEVARKQFGRYIDLDQIYAGLVFLEQPIVDLDEVEAWVNEQEQRQK